MRTFKDGVIFRVDCVAKMQIAIGAADKLVGSVSLLKCRF